ncbi:MAG: outer membrane beta-barrel domain-containing protein [Bdellovibrionaceae bacterium]|nr:outer membrane beta-barrel domain-containing protein [Pseudobdellovibrionaceae bacterium]
MRAFGLCAALILMVFAARADLYDLPTPELIMQKKYEAPSQFGFSLGYLPMNSFSKYMTLGLNYTWKPRDTYGWEVINAQGAAEIASGLKKELVDSYGQKPEDFAVLQGLATTNFVYSPFYMKSLLFNSEMVHSQLSFMIGAGMAKFTNTTVPVLDAGLALKFFLKSRNSFDVDIRYYSFASEERSIRSNIMLSANYAISFGDLELE